MHGRKGKVEIGANAVGKVTGFSYEETVDSADETAMGDDSKSYSGGLPDGSGQVDALFVESDTGQAALIAALKSGVATAVTLTPDGTAGTQDLTGSVTVTNWSINATKDDVISISFSYQGVLTLGAVA